MKKRFFNLMLSFIIILGVTNSVTMTKESENLRVYKSSSQNINSNSSQSMLNCKRNELDFYKYAVSGQVVNEGLKGRVNTGNDKVVFLTFDDGPSTTITPEILKILSNEGVHATFFLLGMNIEKNQVSKEIVKQIYEGGHSIGNHTYSHNYKEIYPNNRLDIDKYLEEINKTDRLLKDVLGEGFQTTAIRMPGGKMTRAYYKDENLNIFEALIEADNRCSVDWNAVNSDATSKKLSKDELFKEAVKSIGDKKFVVLLMHDTYGKEETAETLPMIIQYLKGKGYEFRTIK